MIRDPIYQHIGALIKAKRKTLGLKQETLANTLRISRGSLANIETGRQSILVHQLYNFAAALQLTPIELLPAMPGDPTDEEQSNIPLPPNLNSQQAKQITSLFSQVKTSQNPKKEETRVNNNKR
jgi:transcriptional regulator with XRE-family HTH domain